VGRIALVFNKEWNMGNTGDAQKRERNNYSGKKKRELKKGEKLVRIL